MRRVFMTMIALVLLLTGCASPPTDSAAPSEQAPTLVETSPSQTAECTSPPQTLPSEETLPPHSPLYLEGLSVDAVILYFQEICLDAEVINGGDPSLLQKWTEPILYRVLGDPTQEDLDTVDSFVRWLMTVPGFPGIREAEADGYADMDIFFCTQEEMVGMLGDWAWGCDGGVTFWYDMHQIHSATICVRTDLDQELRSSVILEEMYNGLGPVQDTQLREDSLIWAGYSQPQWLTQEDMLLLKLLYHPDLEPGMDAQQCAEAIRKLYY